MGRLRETGEYAVTNRTDAEMLDRTACAIHVRDFPPLVSDEPPSRSRVTIATDEPAERVARLASLVASYCPVDTLMRPVVPDFDVTWERKPG